MIPEKLDQGDQIRVIAPSRSLGIISEEARKVATERLTAMGLTVTYSQHAEEKDNFNSSSIESRVSDIHDAFADPNVRGILTVIGGFNVNQILKYLDYELIKNNPKILCGYSDITALTNAIYAKTGLVTYSGPHFSTFGMVEGIEYTLGYFKKCLFDPVSFPIMPSSSWSDDLWFLDQKKRAFLKNEGYLIINEGAAEGRSLGGNLCTLNLLQGTEFMPNLKDSVLFLEDDDAAGGLFDVEFDRNLQSLIHLPDFKGVRGIIIGRFQKGGNIDKERLIQIIKSKRELDSLPVIYGADFGHTTPQFTFPIGGTVKLLAKENEVKLEIVTH